MPLFYRARQSQLKTKEGKKQWHLTLVKVGKMVTSQQLAEVIAEKSSLTPGDVHNVIRNLMTAMRKELLNSRSVRLEGIRHFHDESLYTRAWSGSRGRGESESGGGSSLSVYSGIYSSRSYRHYPCFASGSGIPESQCDRGSN